MLLRFSASNFCSIRDEQELSLIALDEHPDLAVQNVPGTDLKALPAAGLFGPNASGKSNFFKALAMLIDSAVRSHQTWLPDEGVPCIPFLLDNSSIRQPTKLSIDFVTAGERHEYALEFNMERFTREELHAIGAETNRRRLLFTRDDNDRIEYGPSFRGQRKAIEEILRPNSSFISTAAATNNPTLMPVYHWFKNTRVALDANRLGRLRETIHIYESHEKQTVLDLLAYGDFDITALEVKRRKRHRERLDTQENHQLEATPGYYSHMDDIDLYIVHGAGNTSVPLPLRFESSGTQTWLGIIGPIISTLRTGGVLAIDEIDARLHSVLVGHLIKLFQDPDTNPRGAQILFNSHDTTLMGSQAPARLHRDQIWLAERNTATGTKIWPLTEYRVRDGLDNVERAYLRGRYGGIPEVDESRLASLLPGEDEEVESTPFPRKKGRRTEGQG